jgi:protein-tyrosine phosphatase
VTDVQHSILFVCMGNICRSPTAEGVTRALVEQAGLAPYFHLDSAGTHDHHVGEAPDRRTQQAALKRGYDLSGQQARQVNIKDFHNFDRILAMDLRNLALLQQRCPNALQDKLGLFLDYAEGYEGGEVPDPYYGGTSGFERVLDMAEAGARGLIRAFAPQLGWMGSSFAAGKNPY